MTYNRKQVAMAYLTHFISVLLSFFMFLGDFHAIWTGFPFNFRNIPRVLVMLRDIQPKTSSYGIFKALECRFGVIFSAVFIFELFEKFSSHLDSFPFIVRLKENVLLGGVKYGRKRWIWHI